MDICAKRGFELIERLAFERVSGSPEEKRAAEILYQEAAATGAVCEIDPFEVEDGIVHSAKLEILEPYYQEYTVNGYIRSDSTDPEGLVADIVYVENALPVNLVDVKGKVALTNGRIGRGTYERLMKAGVVAIVTPTGSLLDRDEDSDLAIAKLRPMMTDDLGTTVAVTLRMRDAMDMIRRHASKVKITVSSECIKRTSHNVYATVQGTDKADEIIAFGAHYDSVFFSTGVYDNAAGSAILMELLRHYSKNPPRRTLRFMWFGSEEQGLLGSKHFVANNEELLKKTKIMINVDVGAPVMGHEIVTVTGEQSAASYIDGLMLENGLAVEVKQDIYSSDCIPFADRGIPAFNFMRFGIGGASFIHDRNDRLFFLSAEALNGTLQTTALFTEHVANSFLLPVATTVPSEITEKVDRYLFKKKDKK